MTVIKKTLARAAFALLCLLLLHAAAPREAAAAEMFSVAFKEIYVKDGKWGIRLTLKNNYKDKDIISFSGLKGEYLRGGKRGAFSIPEYTLKRPVPPGKSTFFDLAMRNKLNPSEVSGVKVLSVNHATRQAATAPAPKPTKTAAPAPARKPAKAAAPAASASFRATAVNEGKDRATVTFEVLNNSSTQPLVRLDNAILSFNAWKFNKGHINFRFNCGTKVVNIPPLGAGKLQLTVTGDFYDITGNVKLQATPRFGQAPQRNDGTTIIIRK